MSPTTSVFGSLESASAWRKHSDITIHSTAYTRAPRVVNHLVISSSSCFIVLFHRKFLSFGMGVRGGIYRTDAY